MDALSQADTSTKVSREYLKNELVTLVSLAKRLEAEAAEVQRRIASVYLLISDVRIAMQLVDKREGRKYLVIENLRGTTHVKTTR